ncbi:MAG: ABC transporter ATP-binding protein [Clostridia bacterium]|nr:ABC transporter ATP-binding protein [Clostridia bacterium]
MLAIKNVTKIFNKNSVNQKTALDNVSLTLEEGDFVTVIGSNGAGKSTLLNVIAGVYPIDTGSIKLEGNEISTLPEHKRAAFIGRVFQDPMKGTAPSMTVEENLALALARGKRRSLRWGISKKDRKLFKEKLEVLGLGLENQLTNKVELLSGGQRQAMTVLMAALVKPKVLLLDEHTAALDPKTADKVIELTNIIVKEHNLTTFMVTHNMEQALTMGNRLIMLHEGQIILELNESQKRNMTVKDLIREFEKVRGVKFVEDRVVLAN